MLLNIFNYVDSDSMLKLTETCGKFKDMIEDSDKLMTKLTLYVEYSKEIDKFRAAMSKSSRSYKNIIIKRSTDQFEASITPAEAFEDVASSIEKLGLNWSTYFAATSNALTAQLQANGAPEEYADITRALSRHDGLIMRRMLQERQEHGGNDIDEENLPAFITFHRPDLLRNMQNRVSFLNRTRENIKKAFFVELVAILGAFPALQTIKLSESHGLEVPSDYEPPQNLSSIRELQMKRCDQNFCISLLAKICAFHRFIGALEGSLDGQHSRSQF